MSKQELAERFKSARQSANKTQEEVAQALGISRSAVSTIETAVRDIGALELWTFAQLVGHPIGYFFEPVREVEGWREVYRLLGIPVEMQK